MFRLQISMVCCATQRMNAAYIIEQTKPPPFCYHIHTKVNTHVQKPTHMHTHVNECSISSSKLNHSSVSTFTQTQTHKYKHTQTQRPSVCEWMVHILSKLSGRLPNVNMSSQTLSLLPAEPLLSLYRNIIQHISRLLLANTVLCMFSLHNLSPKLRDLFTQSVLRASANLSFPFKLSPILAGLLSQLC